MDSSLEMLAVAKAKIPGGDFREGDLSQLPVPDRHADVVVCALALTHVPDLPRYSPSSPAPKSPLTIRPLHSATTWHQP